MRRSHGLPDPSAAHSDPDSCPLTWEESLVTGASIPTFPGHGGLGRDGGVGSRCCCRHPSPALPPTRAPGSGPQKGNGGLCHTGQPGLRSPAPGPSFPGLALAVTPAWARPLCQDHRGQPGGWAAQREGPLRDGQCAPWAVQPSPMSCQCHYPQGATSPAACPLVPVALPCVVSSVLPQRLGWLTLPSHPLTPWGVSLPIFECDFKVRK